MLNGRGYNMKPANITFIIKFEDGEELTIDRSFLKDFSYTVESSSSNSTVGFGIIANSGTLQIFDKNDSIIRKIKTISGENYISVEMLLNGSKQLSFVCDSAIDYNVYDKTITFNLFSPFVSWQKVFVKLGIGYAGLGADVSLSNGIAYEIFSFLKNCSVPFEIVVEPSLLAEMKQTKITIPYLELDTLWNQWNKLCNLLGLRMFQDKDNIIKVVKII